MERKLKRKIYMTEADFNRVLRESVDRIINESNGNDIQQAQKELHSVGNTLSNLGMRLEGTRFHQQYKRMWNEVIKLNDLLIDEIRKNKRLQ